MKKILLILFLLITFSVNISGCGNKESNMDSGTELLEDTKETQIESKKSENDNTTETIEENTVEEISETQGKTNKYTIDGITISVNTFSVEPYEDNSEKYTKRIMMEFTIKNESDSAFGYITSWEGRLNDGYKLESWIDIMSMDLKQVVAGGEKTDTAYFLIDDSVEPNEITVSYNFMDYDEEYWEDFGKIISGQMDQNEYMKKYGDFEVLEFYVTKE